MLEHVHKYLKYSRVMSREQKTIKAINDVSVVASGNTQSQYIDCEGFNEIALTVMFDAVGSGSADIYWSHDGVTNHGFEVGVVGSSSSMQKAGLTKTKARYARIVVRNANTVTHKVSAWGYLKA